MLVKTNEIEEIPILACGSVAPFAGSRSGQVDVQALARRIEDIAHVPIAARAASIVEVVTTDFLGMQPQGTRYVRRR